MALKKSVMILMASFTLIYLSGCKSNDEPTIPESVPMEVNYDSPDIISVEQNNDPATDIESGDHSGPELLSGDNSIDRTFFRVNTERQNELEGNTIFAYLKAVKWKEEYDFLVAELLRDNANDLSWYGYHSSRLFSVNKYTAAIGYARERGESILAASQFEEIAHFYRLLAYDCIGRFGKLGVEKELSTDEETLYQYLNTVLYYAQIPQDEYVSIYEIEENQSNPMPVIASLHDNNIHIAHAYPFGEVLSVDGNDYLYPWDYLLTHQMHLPRLALYDYDNDGIEELSVILYTGSGTGTYTEELHIIEVYESMLDVSVTSETIRGQIYHRLYASYDQSTDEIIVGLDDSIVRIEIVEELVSDIGKSVGFKGFDMDSIISFSAENGSLSTIVTIGLIGFDLATPYTYIDLHVDIIYDPYIHEDTAFLAYGMPHISLSDCSLEYWDYR